ncbi:hypothetical protein IG631_18783 [Alternaria alternata]|nr:hypothetical protein IG631_18783 [Alternaria alternata]
MYQITSPVRPAWSAQRTRAIPTWSQRQARPLSAVATTSCLKVPHTEGTSTEGGVLVKDGDKNLCSESDDKVRDA